MVLERFDLYGFLETIGKYAELDFFPRNKMMKEKPNI